MTNQVCNPKKYAVIDYDQTPARSQFSSYIVDELSHAQKELSDLNYIINETKDSIKSLTPECDKTDYALAASCGVLCGIIDIFLVGKPNESPIGDISDKWFEERTKDFAKLCGANPKDCESLSSAIRFLEKKFPVPYDQQHTIITAEKELKLSTYNHHFKSMGHNPTLLGLFYSILDQFSSPNQSHFSDRGYVFPVSYSGQFELQGTDVPSKLFCAFVNWLGHLMSDISGSSQSKGRGMGIPSPIWCWINDSTALKSELSKISLALSKGKVRINTFKFEDAITQLALEIYQKGYDIRFQSAQLIPVFINEMLVRLIYSIRRMFQFFMNTNKSEVTFSALWESCEPFKNASVKRMLTVAHGSFCAIDACDALIHGAIDGGGAVNIEEVFLRLNIIGVGRFAVSMYGEANRALMRSEHKNVLYYYQRDLRILEYYIRGLKELADIYDDRDLLLFVDDFKNSESYKQAFEKSVILAQKRNVPNEKILRSIDDIDSFFKKGA